MAKTSKKTSTKGKATTKKNTKPSTKITTKKVTKKAEEEVVLTPPTLEGVEPVAEPVEQTVVEVKEEPILNRFFTTEDKKETSFVVDLEPNFWWSRLYEYPFARDLIETSDIILDCACGTYHPFKYGVSGTAKDTYACDLNSELNKEETIKRFDEKGYELLNKRVKDVNLANCDMQNMPYGDNMFDKVFCISALEHLSADIVANGLKEMKRVLKSDGKIVLTIDYPTLTPEDLIKIVESVGLKLYGKTDYTIPQNAISSTYFGGELKCYSMVLIK